LRRETKNCIIRIISILNKVEYSQGISMRRLIEECGKKDVEGVYENHSYITVQKALNYLMRYWLVRSEPKKRAKRGPPSNQKTRCKVYRLFDSRNFRGIKEVGDLGKAVAEQHFQRVQHKNIEAIVERYATTVGAFTNLFLKMRIESELRQIPSMNKEEIDKLRKRLYENINYDTQVLNAFAKEWVNFIIDKFGAKA